MLIKWNVGGTQNMQCGPVDLRVIVNQPDSYFCSVMGKLLYLSLIFFTELYKYPQTVYIVW